MTNEEHDFLDLQEEHDELVGAISELDTWMTRSTGAVGSPEPLEVVRRAQRILEAWRAHLLRMGRDVVVADSCLVPAVPRPVKGWWGEQVVLRGLDELAPFNEKAWADATERDRKNEKKGGV